MKKSAVFLIISFLFIVLYLFFRNNNSLLPIQDNNKPTKEEVILSNRLLHNNLKSSYPEEKLNTFRNFTTNLNSVPQKNTTSKVEKLSLYEKLQAQLFSIDEVPEIQMYQKNIQNIRQGLTPLVAFSINEKALANLDIGDSIKLPLSEVPPRYITYKNIIKYTTLTITDKLENENGSIELKADLDYFLGIGTIDLTVTNNAQIEGTAYFIDKNFVKISSKNGEGYIYRSSKSSNTNIL